MASVRSRRRSDGSVSYAVLFRERSTGKQTSLTYDDKAKAERMRRLGSTPIELVGLRDIAGWLHEMQAKGLAPKTIANVHGLLSSAMKTAIRLGYRSDNSCHGVKLPKGTAASDEMCLLTSSEVGLILAQMTPRYRPLVRFLVGTGLRWGEATALQVGDVVLDGATPSVRVVRA